MPVVAVASRHGLGGLGAVLDGQVEGGDQSAVVGTGGGVVVAAADIVGRAAPLVLVAGGGGLGGRAAVVDGQVEVGDAVAAVGTGTGITGSTG